MPDLFKDTGVLWTTSSVARKLNVNPRYVQREVKQGRLKGKRVGQGYRFTPQQLNDWWNSKPETPSERIEDTGTQNNYLEAC